MSEMHWNCLKMTFPWFRKHLLVKGTIPQHYTPDVLDLLEKRPMFRTIKENDCLDIDTKKAVLKASPSVVALLSYSGDQDLTQCCGFIIESFGDNGHVVLTSAKLIRHHTEENVLENNVADNLKIMIWLNDGGSHEGQVCAYDFHYNVAWIRFQSDMPFPVATLRPVDDYINVNPAEERTSYLRPHSSHFSLVPGHAIIALGRYFVKPFILMAAPGEFSIARCDDFDCKELLKGTCMITECGEGGPVINLSGEVIGISFYENGPTPFLPINIVQKCWEHYKRYGGIWRPFLGIVATNLYAVDVSRIEKVIHKIPSISNGVFVEKVIQGSALDSAGVLVNDVIIQCGGKIVHSLLEFLEMVWDKKVGDVLQLAVVQVSENVPIHINMVVEEVGANNLYWWPRTWCL